MDNLLINLIGMGNQGGSTGNTPLKETGVTEAGQNKFLSILTNVLSGSNNQESLLKQLKEIHESGEPGLANVMSAISNLLMSMIPQDGTGKVPECTDQKGLNASESKTVQEVLPDQGSQKETKDLSGWLEQMNYAVLQGILTQAKSGDVSTDQVASEPVKNGQSETEQVKAFQEEIIKLLSSFNGGPQTTADTSKDSFPDRVGKMTAQEGSAITLQQALLKEGKNAESEIIQTQDTQVAAHLTKDVLEKNAFLLRAMMENGGKVTREDNNKGTNPGDNKGFDGLFKPDAVKMQNLVNPSSTSSDQELNDGDSKKPGGDDKALILNAAKKYKEHVTEDGEVKIQADPELTQVSSQKTNGEVPQADSFRSNVFQVKDNNMTFEKGSFTSFVTDRIEKIVEQFSGKGSQTDMVVRLKLDDKETLLIGLRHEGQKVVVDVKASNDGLTSLLQAHKDDIARHLESKNIFTSIYVQPDGEKNFQRQNQREQNKDDKRKEAGASFVHILEATA
jgi:hypothetical protein